MPLLNVGDARIYYEFQPVDDRPVLLFSNSLGVNLSMWSPQLRAFERCYSILRYDSRGHGRSSVPVGPYSIAQLGCDVLSLLDGLNLQRVHFCGLSMGGMVGQWLGIHASHRLHKLVLSNTAAKIGTPAGWNERIATVLERGMQAVIPATLQRWYTEDFHRDHPVEVAETAAMLLSMDVEGYAASCAAVRDVDHRVALSAVSVPTLILFGRNDTVTSPEDADFLSEKIPDARSFELHSAHLGNIEAATEFNRGVLDFLGGKTQA